MTPNFSPLAFYDDLQRQHHRREYSFGDMRPVIIHGGRICPFQVNIGRSPVKSVGIWRHTDQYVAEVLGSMLDAGLYYVDGGDARGNIAVYPGLVSLAALDAEGTYYLDFYLEDGTHRYSELFCVKASVDGLLRLSWGSSRSLYAATNMAYFGDGFRFSIYLDTRLGRPEYNYEEEATSRLGYTYVESAVSRKTYRFSFVAYEAMIDALRLIRLCDSVLIETAEGELEPITFALEVDWQEQGNLASVTCSCDTDDVVATLGGYAPEKLGGDYVQTAYNDDYLNS
jgi:hypothetical protein